MGWLACPVAEVLSEGIQHLVLDICLWPVGPAPGSLTFDKADQDARLPVRWRVVKYGVDVFLADELAVEVVLPPVRGRVDRVALDHRAQRGPLHVLVAAGWQGGPGS